MRTQDITRHSMWESNVFQATLPIYDDLLEFIINDSKTNAGQKKSNIGGFQTGDDFHKNPITNKLQEQIREMVKVIFTMSKGDVSFLQMWGAINFPGNWNAPHYHHGLSDITFGYYLQVPDNSGKLCIRDPRIRGLRSYFWVNLEPDIKSQLPGPGTLLMFPSYLDHYVEPNLSNEDRIMISGDLRISI